MSSHKFIDINQDGFVDSILIDSSPGTLFCEFRLSIIDGKSGRAYNTIKINNVTNFLSIIPLCEPEEKKGKNSSTFDEEKKYRISADKTKKVLAEGTVKESQDIELLLPAIDGISVEVDGIRFMINKG
jgi:hypothetical protein